MYMVQEFWLAGRQWGEFLGVNNGGYITLPLWSMPIQVVATDMASDNNSLCLSTLDYVEGKFKATGRRFVPDSSSQLWGHWIAVCK